MELPVDMALYLPESWAKACKRCRAARIPDSVEYRAKWRIALDLATDRFGEHRKGSNRMTRLGGSPFLVLHSRLLVPHF